MPSCCSSSCGSAAWSVATAANVLWTRPTAFASWIAGVADGNRRRVNTTSWETWETIVANESGPKAGVEGVVEDVKGRAKEAVGAVAGDESLKREGEAQQDKAAAQRDVAAKEAEAEKARAEASAAEAEQRSHQ